MGFIGGWWCLLFPSISILAYNDPCTTDDILMWLACLSSLLAQVINGVIFTLCLCNHLIIWHMICYLSDGMLLFSVPPPVHEDPVHNYMSVPHGEANPVTHIPVTLALQVSVMLSKKRKLNQWCSPERKKNALSVMFKLQTWNVLFCCIILLLMFYLS